MLITTDTDRVVKVLTHTEGLVIQEFLEVTEGKIKGTFTCKDLKASNACIVATLKKLEMVGIINTQSRGHKGTFYEILNLTALKLIAERVGVREKNE